MLFKKQNKKKILPEQQQQQKTCDWLRFEELSLIFKPVQ